MINKKPKSEAEEWDNALLDLINMGVLEVATGEDGTKGFRLTNGQI